MVKERYFDNSEVFFFFFLFPILFCFFIIQVEFTKELAVNVTRGLDGKIVAHPVVETVQKESENQKKKKNFLLFLVRKEEKEKKYWKFFFSLALFPYFLFSFLSLSVHSLKLTFLCFPFTDICHTVIAPAQISAAAYRRAMQLAEKAISTFEGAGKESLSFSLDVF